MSGIATNTDKEVSRLSLVAKACAKNNHQWSGLLVAGGVGGWGVAQAAQALYKSHSAVCPDEQEFSVFNAKVSMSHRIHGNRPLSVQNKQRPRQIIPIGRHCRRTEVDMQETRAGPGQEAARQRRSAPPLANKQYCCKKKKKKKHKRKAMAADWSLLEMDAGRERMTEQDTFVAETEVEIRVCV